MTVLLFALAFWITSMVMAAKTEIPRWQRIQAEHADKEPRA